MKVCKNCFREFGEEDVLDVGPAAELADIVGEGVMDSQSSWE